MSGLTRRAALGATAAVTLAAAAVRAAPARGKIDTHQHFLPKVYVDAVGLDDLASVMPNRIAPKWSPEAAVAMMDGLGIAEGILSISSGPVMPNAATVLRKCNDEAARLSQQFKRRFGSFASLPLPDIDASLKEAAYALDTLNADGVIVFASYAGKYLGDPSFAPLWDELNRRKAAVFIHPNHPPYSLKNLPPEAVIEFPFETTRTAASLMLSGALRRWPDIAFILSHGGGTLPYIAPRIAGMVTWNPELHERVGDAAAAFRRFWYDTAIATSPSQLPALLTIADPAKITFGTDFPMAPGFVINGVAADLASAKISEAERAAIGRGNAARLLKRGA